MDESNGFDRVAFYYDRLSRLVFGKAIKRSQTLFLDKLQPCTHVLVLGGGTGWWLKEFLLKNPTCKILFVEPSQKMLDRARKVVAGDERVTFLLGTVNSISEMTRFDGVITFFVLDIFSNKALDEFIKRINPLLASGAIWLVADFVKRKWWHGGMLSVMYGFFRIATGLQNQSLPNWEASLRAAGLTEKEQNMFWGDFIKTAFFKAP